MSAVEWLSLAGICLLGAMSPGPSLAVVVAQTLRGGAGRGIQAGLAHGFGVGLYAVAVVSGLAILVTTSETLYSIIQWGGAGFLLYLGIKSLRASGNLNLESASSDEGAHNAALQGFAVAFLNPKLAIWFLALFSQFLDADTGLAQKVIMVVTVAAIDGIWYSGIALVLGRPGVLERLRGAQRTIDRVFGVILIGLAIRVVVPMG